MIRRLKNFRFKLLSIFSVIKWHDQVESYYDRVLHPGAITRNASLYIAILYSCVIQLMITLVIPLDRFTRLLLHDPTLFFGLPQRNNWLHCMYFVNDLYMQYEMNHRQSQKLVMMLKQVANGQELDFFVKQQVEQRGAFKYVAQVVCYYASFWIHMVRQFYLLAVAILIFFDLCLFRMIYYDYLEFCFFTWSGNLSLLVAVANSIIFDIAMISFAHIHLIWGHTVVVFTLTFFTKLRQTNQLLIDLKAKQGRLTSSRLRLFTRHHTQTLTVIFEFNRVYGKLLLAFMLFNLPQNTFIFTEISLDRLAPVVKFVYVNYFAGEIVFMIVFHALGAMYSDRIHRCRKLLFHFSAKKKFTPSSVRGQIHLTGYIEKFNNTKHYGITYGPFGLMSFASFAKFMLLYGEFLMYWFRIINRFYQLT